MSNDRFVRWQTNTMAQLSTALSMFCGLSVAAIGFLLSLLRENDFKPSGYHNIFFLIAMRRFPSLLAHGLLW